MLRDMFLSYYMASCENEVGRRPKMESSCLSHGCGTVSIGSVRHKQVPQQQLEATVQLVSASDAYIHALNDTPLCIDFFSLFCIIPGILFVIYFKQSFFSPLSAHHTRPPLV